MNKFDKQAEYKKLVKKFSPSSKLGINCLRAFAVGGFISVIGQIFLDTYINMGLSKDDSLVYVTITLIFISTILTGLGLYSKLGKFAGGGSAIPITGFANSVASSAIEFKKEGYVLGVGTKIFILAGPVIVYGLITSVILGLVYFLINL